MADSQDFENACMSLFEELKRRNVFRVGIAYAVTSWLLLQVADIVLENIAAPGWVMQVFMLALGLGFPLALFFAWAFELTPAGLKKEKDVDRTASITSQTGRKLDYIIIAVMALALSYFIWESRFSSSESADGATVEEAVASGEKSIAVLPFINMSDDPANAYFSDGISEELLNVLVKVEGLRVASRTSSFAFRENKGISIPEIARELNVDHVLEGSVRKAGNKVRVTAQLIDVRTDRHLWSATYDRELEDIFAIQDEISEKIVQALKIALGADEQQAMAHVGKPTDNLEAYEFYLRGRYFWQRRGEENIRRAISLFEQATALDSQFARAWSSLAAAHTTLPTYSDAPREVQHPLAVEAAQKALILDDSLAEAHAVLGDMARMNKKWLEAQAYYLRAIDSEPKNSTAHLWYAEHLMSVGRVRDAQEENLIAYQLDPLHPGTNANLAQVYMWLNDPENAMKFGAAAWDMGHRSGLWVLTLTNLELGNVDRAIELAGQFDEQIGTLNLKLLVEAKIDAMKRPTYLKFLAENERDLSFTVAAATYVEFGLMDDAYRLADRTMESFYANAPWVFWIPEMALFRQDSRFADLVTELGLVDYWREYGWPDACQPAGQNLSCQ
ncbi:MAG: tetratricopeptide repeat protein [Proteobacteria bacterium]|nr:tetratricopeptide repeat protein [Pseudomonadota bacterium]